MINRAALVCLTLALIAALTACGIDDFPENAARQWIQAIADGDTKTISERTCPSHQADVWQVGLNSPLFKQLAQPANGQRAQIDPNKIYFTTVESYRSSAQVESATVQVTGAVKVLGQEQKVDEMWQMVQLDWKWKWCGLK